MVDIASLAIQIDTSDVARAENDLERLGSKGAKAEQAAKGVGDAYQQASGKVGAVAGAASKAGTALERNSVAARENARELASVDRTASSLSGSMSKLGATLAGLTAGMSIKGIIDISDNYGQMADRIKMATDSTEEYRMVQERLLQSANKTYRPLAEAQELYIRTADAIRSLGYQTKDALDITDSFSYLLVTNAASADKASNAIDAYSKSIQSGRIEVDSWQSLIAAMPSVVETLSRSLGKSAEEIRKLGITGKLSLSDLNEGLRQTVDANQKLADGMGTTLNDALVRASNNMSAYLGESSKVTASSRLLSGALDGVTENIDLIASVLGGAAVAAITRYTVVTGQSTAASIAHSIAVKRQAAEELQLAQAQVASTAAAVAQARANVGLVGSMGQVTAALTAQEAAQKRLAAAQASSVSLGRTVLGLAGGWVGIALSAGAVAASFYDWSDSADEVQRSAIDLTGPLDALIDKWKELGDAQRVSMGRQAEQDLKATTQTMAEEAAKVEAAFYKLGNVKGLPVESWLAPLREFRDATANGGQGINDFAQQLLDGVPAGSDFRRVVEDAAAAIESQGGKAETLRGFLKTLEDQTRSNAAANRELADTSDATGNSFLQSLQRRADLSGKLTEVQKTQIAIEKGYAGVLSETAKQEALAAAAVIDRANASLTATKGLTKATDEQAKAFQSLYDNLHPAETAQRQYNDQVKLLKQYLSGDQLAKSIDRLNHAIDGADATGPADAIEEYRKALETLEDRLDPAGKATKVFREEQKRLTDAIKRGGPDVEKYRRLLVELEKQYDDNTRATSEWAKWTEGALDRVDGAFADAWRNIGDGFDGFRDSLTNAFKQMLAELAHMAITKPIIMQIGASLGIGGGTQGNNGIWGSLLGGSSGGAGGGMGGALQAANQARSIYSMYGTAQTLLPVLQGGYASGGFGGALTGVGSYVGSLFGGAGTASSMAAGSTAAGYTGSAYASWAAAQGAGSAAGAGASAGVGGALSSVGGMLSNPVTWIVAGMVASNKLYSQGVRADGSKTAEYAKDSSAIGKAAWAPFTVGSYAVEKMDKLLGSVFGNKFTAIVTGSPVFQAITDFIGGGIFGGKWQTKDVGIGLGVSGGDLLAQQYEDQKKKGGWFKSDKKRTNWSDLDPETAAALQQTYEATETAVSAIFESLSLTVEEGALDGLQLARKKISTKGKTEEQIQEAIAEWFGSAADAMTAELNKVFATGLDLDLEGMQAFVGNLQGVNEVLRYLDVGMYDASVAGGKLAEALSAAAGGLEALATNSQTYYDAFFSAEEKTADTIDAITRAFESADVELAASREAYRAMVEDIDLTTEAGQEMFATLMALSGQAAQYYSIVEQKAAQAAAEVAAANAALIGSVGTAYAALQRSIAAQQRDIQASVANTANNISALTGIGNSLDAALKRLRGTSDDTVRSLRAQAVMTLNSALVTARAGGSLAGFEGLQDALDVASEMDTALYGSLTDFEREQGRTANLIAELEKVNGKQLSTEQRMLEQYEKQLSKLDEQLAFAQSQLDALDGIDNSIMGVAAAISAMNASVVAALQAMPKDAAKSNTPQNNRSIVDSIYQSVLGRGTQGDEAGASFWANALQSGTATYQDIATSIAKGALANAGESSAGKKSAEQYLKSLGIPGFASGGYTGRGDKYDPAGIVHKGEVVWSQSDIAKWGGVGAVEAMRTSGPQLEVTGPSRIYNASQTAAMLGGGGDAAAEVRAMRADFAGMTNALRSVAKHTMQTAKRVEFLERWDFDGLPKERGAA
jgi:tape measure domain-containing protein